MRFYRNDSHDPAFNLALEELLTQEHEDCFMLWRNAPSIIIGKNQNTAAEVNAEFVRRHEIRVVRRITGGGAVYHDLGNVNFSLIIPAEEWSQERAEACCSYIVQPLRGMGLDCHCSGRNDILCGGVKISGCARSVQKNRMLFHGTILYDVDLEVLSRALNPDPEKILSKGIASVRARVGNLRQMLGNNAPDTDVFLNSLAEAVARNLSLKCEAPGETIRRRAEKLAQEKYRTWEWNYGTVFQYDLCRKKHFPGGMVAAEMKIDRDKIREVRFTGDFFVNRPLDGLEKKLAGAVPEREQMLALLRELHAESFIAGVSAENLTEILCL